MESSQCWWCRYCWCDGEGDLFCLYPDQKPVEDKTYYIIEVCDCPLEDDNVTE